MPTVRDRWGAQSAAQTTPRQIKEREPTMLTLIARVADKIADALGVEVPQATSDVPGASWLAILLAEESAS